MIESLLSQIANDDCTQNITVFKKLEVTAQVGNTKAAFTVGHMLGDITMDENIYIACGHTDMRKSIDSLSGIVQQ